jgi:hypothetical protein
MIICFKSLIRRIFKYNDLLLFSALTKVYEKANSVVSYDVDCPNWLHKYIIGKKGSKLHALMGDLQKTVHTFLSPNLFNYIHHCFCDPG